MKCQAFHPFFVSGSYFFALCCALGGFKNKGAKWKKLCICMDAISIPNSYISDLANTYFKMKTDLFTVGPFAENTYLLTIENQSLLVDPGFSSVSEFQTFKRKMEERKSELLAVLLTHAHVDHVLGLNQVMQSFECPVYLNHSDLYLWENFEQQSAMFGIRAAGFSFTPLPLAGQKGLEIGPFSWDVLYTPGHSPDHVSLYNAAESILIVGDALFRESIGRTDLYKGDFELLASSIKEKLYTLPDDTVVYPGHGPKTTIGHEKSHNPFVKG